jgi:hypothetical protein
VGLPQPVDLNLDVQVGTVSLTYDGTTLFFSAVPAGGGARRIYAGELLSPTTVASAEVVPSLNQDGGHEDSAPGLSGDGETIYFCSNRISGSDAIWRAERVDGSGARTVFGTPARVGDLDVKGQVECDPSISPDGRTLLVAANASTDLNYEVLRATLDDGGRFGAYEPVAEVNSAETVDGFPFVAADGLALYLARAPLAFGERHIFVATRASADQPFGPPMQLAGLGKAGTFESSPTLSADGCRLYYTSEGQILMAERSPD